MANIRTNKSGEPRTEALRDLRSTIAYLKKEGDLVETDVPVNPDLEITGIQKHLDGSCPLLFNNVVGKPNHRVITNLFGDYGIMHRLYGWKDGRERTLAIVDALRHPLAPIVVDQGEAPVQQHVIEKPENVNDYIVPIRHTEEFLAGHPQAELVRLPTGHALTDDKDEMWTRTRAFFAPWLG